MVRRRETSGVPHRYGSRCEEGNEADDEECRVGKRGVDVRLIPRFVRSSERGAGIVVVTCDIEPCLVGHAGQVDHVELVVSLCRRGAAANRRAEHVVVAQNEIRVSVTAGVFDSHGVVVGGRHDPVCLVREKRHPVIRAENTSFRREDLDSVTGGAFDSRGVLINRASCGSPRHVDRGDLHVGGELVEESDVASRRGFRHRVIHLLQRADSNGGRVGIEGRRRDRAVRVQRRNEACGEGCERVARAGRGSRIRCVDVARKVAKDWFDGAPGRRQVSRADGKDVGGSPIEGRGRGVGAAVGVERADESSDEHDAQNCKHASTEELCDLRHSVSLLQRKVLDANCPLMMWRGFLPYDDCFRSFCSEELGKYPLVDILVFTNPLYW